MTSTVGELIARRIRHYRQTQGLTQQAVSDRTEKLGARISRDNLAKIETAPGRAESLPVVDMLVLAAALDVPPVLLLLPLGEEEEVMITPGVPVHPHLALDWIVGRETFTRDGYSAPWDEKAFARNAQPCRAFDRLRWLQDASASAFATDDDRKRLADHVAAMEADGYSVPTIPGIHDGKR